MIAVIDYDIGNVRSILEAFKNQSADVILTNDEDEILKANGIIIPGVGSFSQGMENLKKYGLDEKIKKFVTTNKPLLGICLGMQLLFEESEEFGNTKGLSIISGKVVELPTKDNKNEKLPHVSWNEINSGNISWKSTILENIEEGTDMYFVHSFIAQPKDDRNVLSLTEYSNHKFCSSVKKENIYGCQYHPEKSGPSGLKIINNFISLSYHK